MVAVLILSLSLTLMSHIHCSSVGLPTATSETKSFSFFHSHLLATSCWPFLTPYLNAAIDFAFDLGFTCMHMFTLCDSSWTLSSPWATLMRSEIRRELTVSDLISCFESSSFFPATSNMTEESYKLQTLLGHLLGAGKGKQSLPMEWSLGGKVEGRPGYTTEENAVKSCCQEVSTGSYFGFWFWNCCAIQLLRV